jgi:hypothetical protein
MNGIQSRHGRYEEEKNVLILLALDPQFFDFPARSLVTVPRGVTNEKN